MDDFDQRERQKETEMRTDGGGGDREARSDQLMEEGRGRV